jgi:hypothetical protein
LLQELAFGGANTLVDYKYGTSRATTGGNDVAQNGIANLKNPASEVNGVMEFYANRLLNGFHGSCNRE